MRVIIFLFLYFLPFANAYSLNFCPLNEEDLLRSIDVIEGRWIESSHDLQSGELSLVRSFFASPRSLQKKGYGWHFNLPIFSESTSIQALAHRKYSCERDEQGRLTSICCLTELENEPTGALSFSYAECPSLQCTVKSAEGRMVRYWFEPFEKEIHLLSKVEMAEDAAITYKYRSHPNERRPLLTERSEAGETLFYTYWESGKLREIRRRENDQAAIVTVCSIEYSNNETVVRLPKDTIRFSFSKEHLLTAIKTSLRELRFEWESGKVIKKTILDRSGRTLSAESFCYDQAGRLIGDTLKGNLTGDGEKEYSRHYLYDAKGRLIHSGDNNGAVTTWSYEGASSYPQSKCEAQNGIALLKTEYVRNEKGFLTEERVSDSNPEGSKRVSITRHIRFSADGKPLETIQGYEGIEEKRTVLSFDRDGKLLSKEVFDGKGALIESCQNFYDFEGKIEKEQSIDGSKIYLYDDFKKLKETIESSEGKTTHTLFDEKKRVIWQKTQNLNEVARTLSFEYNLEGKISATLDHLGQRIEYTYDAQGRKISEKLPPLLKESGEWVTPTIQYFYDAFDRIIEIVDPSGYSTKTAYNARGQPIRVDHPDGTHEEFKYSIDGKIEQTRTREGLLIIGMRDLYDRVTFEETFDRKGNRILFKEYTYDAFDLKKEMDSSGGSTSYEYDPQGRLIKTLTENCNTEFLYDLPEKLFLKRRNFKNDSYETYFDPNVRRWFLNDLEGKVHLEKKEEKSSADQPPQECIVTSPSGKLTLKTERICSQGVKTVTFSDGMGRPFLIEKLSPNNELLFKQEIFYALCGKVALEKNYRVYKGKIRDCIENRFFYGPSGRIECAIERWGSSDSETTNYSYDDFGQLSVVQKPDGVCIFYDYNDAAILKRLSSSEGSIDYEFLYDKKNNPSTIINHVTGAKTIRKYDSRGLICEETLENGLKIAFEHDEQGRRCKTFLPDGSLIEYEFESLFLKNVKKSDRSGKILYTHSYLDFNHLGKPTLEQGIFQSGVVKKQYSECGSLSSIIQSHFSQKKMDNHNCIISSTDQGQFQENYVYDLLGQIVSVEGDNPETYHFDSFGTEAERHFSSTYDLNGNLIEKRVNGKIFSYSYDALNRLIAVSEEGIPLQKMGYDALHRRTFLQSEKEIQYFLYDGNMEIGSFDETHSPLEIRVLGLSQGAESLSTVAIELSGTPYAPLHDLQGSICGLVSLEGELKSLRTFQAFGRPSQWIASLKCPWGYFSKREDPVTGLINFGRRFYDPACKSWISKDPIGFADGPNRRLFVKNDPLHFQDHFGLSAIPQDSYSVKEHLKQLLQQAGVKILNAMRKLRDYMTMDKEQMLNYLIGSGVLHFLGLKKTGEESGVYGLGEVNDKVRVSFINGILTDYTSLYSNLQALSESHGHVNIHYVYRPTKGWVWDIVHSFLVKLGYVSKEAKKLASEWQQMIQEMGGVDGGGKIIHYAHSIGAVESLRALSLLSPEEQKLISMYAFGSPNISSKAGLTEIHHFVSVRDGVSLLDPIGFIRACRGGLENVLFVGSFLGLPLVDHLFTAQTYQDLWRSMGRTFVEWYGAIT